MKITQQPEFQPITIVLETKEEAEALYKAAVFIDSPISDLTKKDVKIFIFISNWFSNYAKL